MPFSASIGEVRQVAGRLIYMGNEPFKQVAIRSGRTTYIINNPDKKLRKCQRKQCIFTIKLSQIAEQGKESLLIEVISFQLKP